MTSCELYDKFLKTSTNNFEELSNFMSFRYEQSYWNDGTEVAKKMLHNAIQQK